RRHARVFARRPASAGLPGPGAPGAPGQGPLLRTRPRALAGPVLPAPVGAAAAPPGTAGRAAPAPARPGQAHRPERTVGLAVGPPPERSPAEERSHDLAQGRFRPGRHRILKITPPGGGLARTKAARSSVDPEMPPVARVQP